MLHSLSISLRSILGDTGTPDVVRNAEIAFDRPVDTYTPQTTTINLFLYDIREAVELRSHEPFIERRGGIATLRRPPLRVACSYLVTVWTGADLTGEAAILKQHELLGEVLRVFAGMPTLPPASPTSSLASQPYPVPLVTLQSELMRNPAEFWSALGGKLRPSFTLTATIAMEVDTAPVTAPEVSTKKIVVRELAGGATATLYQIGGTVRDAGTHKPIAGVELTLPGLGMGTRSDAEGRFAFSGIAAGGLEIAAATPGYGSASKPVQVPGTSATAFDIDLTVTS